MYSHPMPMTGPDLALVETGIAVVVVIGRTVDELLEVWKVLEKRCRCGT